MTKDKDSYSKRPTSKRFILSILPKPDNRANEWSPIPTGVIIAAFGAPVGTLFLIGCSLDTDTGLSPLYGFLAFVCALGIVWAMSDASYIAGMRRIANQDLPRRDMDKNEKSSHEFRNAYDEYPTIRPEVKKSDDEKNGK